MHIHIHHLDAHYKISRSRESPSVIQRRLDRIAGDLLAVAWENRLAGLSQGSDEAMYFIERMEMDLALELSQRDDHVVADVWAQALQHGLLRTLSHRDNGVIVFEQRSEFLASFLEDLLHGRAWEKWYYRELEPLRSLSLGQAALKILAEDGDVGRDALLELTRRGDLDLLLAALTDAEVEAMASQCLLPPGPNLILANMHAIWIQAVRSLLASQRVVLTSVLSRDLVRLYLSLLRERPELGPDVNLARFIRDLLQSQQVEALQPLIQAEAPQPLISRASTPYGGIFLLIPAIVAMRLPEFLQRCPYPEPSGMPKAGLLLLVIALQCLGRRNAEKALADKALALFAGLSTPIPWSHLQRYAEALTAEIHEAFVKSFRTHVVELVKRPGMFLWSRNTSEHLNPSAALSLYSEAGPFLPDRKWDEALSAVSSTVLRWFASKLGAFAESSPDYLRRNFLESHAEIEVFADRIVVHFLTSPLQMVLRMAGFDHGTWEVPWLEGKKLAFRFD